VSGISVSDTRGVRGGVRHTAVAVSDTRWRARRGQTHGGRARQWYVAVSDTRGGGAAVSDAQGGGVRGGVRRTGGGACVAVSDAQGGRAWGGVRHTGRGVRGGVRHTGACALTASRFRLFTSVTVKTGTAAHPFGQQPVVKY
jgi:hypothetical protein